MRSKELNAASTCRVRVGAAKGLLVFSISAAALSIGVAGLAAPYPFTLFHNFGPALSDCPGFDLHLAFADGRIAFTGVKAADGSDLPWKFGTQQQGAMTLALGSGQCALSLKLERQSP